MQWPEQWDPAERIDSSRLFAGALACRRELHRYPELAWQEEGTAAYIRRGLDRLGISWEPCAGTGTIARLAADRSGSHLAFRADIDALPITEATGLPYASSSPGCMHACGHDGHTATLLTAAVWLQRQEQELPGPVSLLFQPAEEGERGAERMVAEGALEGIDCILGYHNWPAIPFGRFACPDGTIMGSNGHFFIRIEGRGGHASQPESCRDPVLAAGAIIVAAQSLVSRRAAPQDSAVISITMVQAGQTPNIIPAQAELQGTIRGLTTRRRDELAQELADLVRGQAASFGCTAELVFHADYPATVNHAVVADVCRDHLRKLFGQDCLWQQDLPILASEDFSFYLEQIPGAFILAGTGMPDADNHPCHSPHYDFVDAIMPPMLQLWSSLAGGTLP